MASTALTVGTSRAFLESRKDEFAKALVNRIDPDAFLRVAHMAMTKQPKLLECTQSSILMALLEAASLGLMPNGVMGHAYLIPYKNNGVLEAQFQPGYRGLIDLARRSGQIKSIMPRSVYSNDQWAVEYGLKEKLEHVPNLEDPGELRFVYAVATQSDGAQQFRVMSLKEVNSIRARSKAKDSGPWVTDYEAMAWKTVIRGLLKFLPSSLEVDQAIQQDDAAEFGGEYPVYNAVPERQSETRTQQVRSRISQRIAPPLTVEAVEEEPLTATATMTDPSHALEEFADAFAAIAENPNGGDATPKQRKELLVAGEKLFGQNSDEARAVRAVAENKALGRAQAGALLALAAAAAPLAATADPFGED